MMGKYMKFNLVWCVGTELNGRHQPFQCSLLETSDRLVKQRVDISLLSFIELACPTGFEPVLPQRKDYPES